MTLELINQMPGGSNYTSVSPQGKLDKIARIALGSGIVFGSHILRSFSIVLS